MLRLILLIVVLVLILSFFNISLRTLVFSPSATANFEFLWQLVVQGWNITVAFVESSLAHLSHGY